ncbi:PSD1 and planctomycete cytochrome C domain-containing protein [Thalassoroseus pseudoceratinae]|uniref:PSD1 and planctomycete cytochrome C domain-containing protein n=1 Tax=Thalassoroseus pseudoceratinae TaxID=2713176 RepID=UPI00197E0A3A|nr:PSD1 and planctomycete cytochrome C domain-containing protein [Thalassoroseus pseudoceratinae]
MANRDQQRKPYASNAKVTVASKAVWFLCVTVAIFALQNPSPAVIANDSTIDANRLFTLKVLPLLKQKCFGCHGNDPKDIRGGYDLLSREGMLKGGDSGETSIVPGKPAESSLYQAVLWETYEMPPKETDRLTKAESEYIRKWIAAGAPWPNDETQRRIKQEEWSVRENENGIIVDTSGGLSNDWTYRRYQPQDIWAFQPVRKFDHQNFTKDGQNPIDFFIDRKLHEAGLSAAPQADPRTLIRRLTFDLTGLPPSQDEINTFLEAWKKDSQHAWADLTTRLLNSDHYGERQAQHWLDVVRYADTAGFSNDYERSNAWRYRDYVIRSFNNDKPFNEFVVEQIAGDELRPNDPEARIATGLLRMGPWGTAMIPKDEARQIYLDDLVHNVGQTFLAMPMRCCKCHDHKFDPIPTRDYYRMYATFAATQPAEMPVDFLPVENRNGFAKNRALTKELLDFAKAELAKVNNKQEAAAKKWYAEHNRPYKNENARKNDPEDQKPPRHVGLTPEEKGIKKVREQDVWIWQRRLERYQPMAQTVYNGPPASFVNSRKLRKPNQLNKKWQPESFILAGGSLEAPQDAVKPGVLSATGQVSHEDKKAPYLLTEEVQGRRLEFAKWVANDDNPLTARVIVNRVWASHFGQGIVKTANNFGAKGSKPTHPELLDWLTADFIENGWKIKRLHRLIVSSETYRRSGKSADHHRQTTVDPNNERLSSFPPRRLTAEEIRDGILAVTGELNREMGGVPIMPEINMEVALQPRMIQFSIAPAHQASRTPAERNRRTIYAYRVRGQADPFLEILNLPNPNESCELRDSAAVTPQAFTLLNSDTITDRSIAFALRVQKERPDDTEQWIRHAVQIAYGRKPTSDEQSLLHEYLKEMQVYHQNRKPNEVKYPTQVTRSLVEEFTGEPFEFIEKLNAYEDYTPDAKPWTVDSDTRALADVCLLLLNSNEFIYVY